MRFAEDSKPAIIARRVLTNAQWASIYLAQFEASNEFLRANNDRLDPDAHEVLYVLDRALPRVSALCLCRLWDKPSKDRHSLPTLLEISEFRSVANAHDPAFLEDCKNVGSSDLIHELRRFRIVDLAHNLSMKSEGGLTYDRLRDVLAQTQPVIDRLLKIMQFQDAAQRDAFEIRKIIAKNFWKAAAPAILESYTSDLNPPTKQ